MAVNTILWSISYPEVRALHAKEELEEHVNLAIGVIDRCTERWPGTAAAAGLYRRISEACMRSYSHSERASSSSLTGSSPASALDGASPASTTSSNTAPQVYQQKLDVPTFGYVFNEAPDSFAADAYHKNLAASQPSFRTGSIFVTPATTQTDRRFSYFPPEYSQQLPSSWDNIPPLPQHAHALDPPNIPRQARQRSGQSTVEFAVSGDLTNLAQDVPQFQISQYQDPAFFGVPQALNFAPHLYDDFSYGQSGRSDSLSLTQQQELLASLETGGMDWIDNNLGLTMPQQHLYGSEG